MEPTPMMAGWIVFNRGVQTVVRIIQVLSMLSSSGLLIQTTYPQVFQRKEVLENLLMSTENVDLWLRLL